MFFILLNGAIAKQIQRLIVREGIEFGRKLLR